MQAFKWGLLSVPALAGFTIGIQQATKSSSNIEATSTGITPPEPQQINPQPSSDLVSQKGNLLAQLSHNEVQKVDLNKPVFSKLHDYTFKLITPCSLGTGWILDYQIPKKSKTKENNYPTVWYIATAAHVVNNWKFEKKNIYEQVLPKKCKPRWETDFYFEVAKRDEKVTPRLGARLLKKQRIKNPRLFWTALDLFNKDTELDIKDNNFKDFAVLEVTFDNAQIAREMTKGFADKYTTNSNNQLDIFGEALEPEKTQADNKSLFYSLGYPLKNTDESFLKNNWSEGKHKGDKLSNDSQDKYHIPHKDKVRGFLSAKHFQGSDHEFKWGDKQYNEFGHFYYTNGVKLGAGASGSMVVDEHGKILGVRSLEGDYSLFTPLRSKPIKRGEIKTPKYDLILGTEKQKSSYKGQVEKYLLKNGKETWLSSSRNWTYKE